MIDSEQISSIFGIGEEAKYAVVAADGLTLLSQEIHSSALRDSLSISEERDIFLVATLRFFFFSALHPSSHHPHYCKD
jgi:hypothetical protein